MADPPAAELSADSTMASAATLNGETTDLTRAKSNAIINIPAATPTSQAPAQFSTAGSTMALTEHGALPESTTDMTISSSASEPTKLWPRLHLLGLPRELRDKIYRYAIVREDPCYVSAWFDFETGKGHFNAMPGLTQASRQLRLETRLMFLEENTLKIPAIRVLMTLSAKPFEILKALCTGVELQNVQVDFYSMSFLIHGYLIGESRCLFSVTKTVRGLEVKRMKAPDCGGRFSEGYYQGGYVPCCCRMQRLASQYDGEETTILQFLGALRDDWFARSRDICDASKLGWGEKQEDHEHDPDCYIYPDAERCNHLFGSDEGFGL